MSRAYLMHGRKKRNLMGGRDKRRRRIPGISSGSSLFMPRTYILHPSQCLSDALANSHLHSLRMMVGLTNGCNLSVGRILPSKHLAKELTACDECRTPHRHEKGNEGIWTCNNDFGILVGRGAACQTLGAFHTTTLAQVLPEI